MEIQTYRGAPFLYRKREIDFLVEFFKRVPQRVLWVYGPKSSGKTTLISYVVDNYLLQEKERFWVKYLNLREKIITSYRSFLDSFFMPEEMYDVEVKRDIEFSVQIFRVRREDLRSLRQKETDWGKILIEEVKTGCSQG
ncbi:MAG: ATP-binding protein, partial [Desulfonauticus sp.]|nr:ATP-binding protein [Desulfonauticus sp.]